MDRIEIVNRVQNIFRDVFDRQDIVLADTMTSADVEDWDSLNHINLVSAIERDLGIRFGLGELHELQNVGDMINLIQAKKR